MGGKLIRVVNLVIPGMSRITDKSILFKKGKENHVREDQRNRSRIIKR